jgi:hypothetical protein
VAEEGGLVDETQLQKSKINSLVFGQKWNEAWALAVGKTTKKETVRFLEQQGVRVVKAPGNGCQNFSFLQDAIGDDLGIWQQAVSEITGGVLLGLYPGREWIQGEQVVGADYALIVRADTNRYTLLHEMGHYLLHRYRLESGLGNVDFEKQLRAKAQEVQTSWETNQKFPSPSAAVRLADAWVDAVPLFDENVKRSSLEESAVEDFLSRAFLSKDIAFVPKEDALGGWYLIANLDRAREYYGARQSEAEKVTGELNHHLESALKTEIQQLKAKLQSSMDLIKQRLAEIDQVEKSALSRRQLLKKLMTQSKGGAQVPIARHDPGCGRQNTDWLQTALF